MMKIFIPFMLLFLSCSSVLADHPKTHSGTPQVPIDIQSEQVEFNQKKGVAIYSGHVVASQLEKKIEADTATIYRHPSGQIARIIAQSSPTKPVHYEDNSAHPPLIAHADTIEYDAMNKIIHLRGHAELIQGPDHLHSDQIDYDTQKRVVRTPKASQQTQVFLHPES